MSYRVACEIFNFPAYYIHSASVARQKNAIKLVKKFKGYNGPFIRFMPKIAIRIPFRAQCCRISKTVRFSHFGDEIRKLLLPINC